MTTRSLMRNRIFMALVITLAGAFLGYQTFVDLRALVTTGCIPYKGYEGCHTAHIAATLFIEVLTMGFFAVIIYHTMKRED